jgi:hypothetical protein
MAVSIINKEDLQEFKTELLEEIKNLFHIKTSEQKLWLRSSEAKALLKISSGTLQNLRINGTLRYSKVGGTIYYNYQTLKNFSKKNNVVARRRNDYEAICHSEPVEESINH